MSKVSRRSLASYGADELLAGTDARKVAKYLAAALTESGRANEYELLVNDVLWELENRGQLAVGNVSSAHPLTQNLKKKLADQIKQAVKVQSVVIEEQIDKSLLGGVRVETASRIWDQTLSGKLAKLREVF